MRGVLANKAAVLMGLVNLLRHAVQANMLGIDSDFARQERLLIVLVDAP